MGRATNRPFSRRTTHPTVLRELTVGFTATKFRCRDCTLCASRKTSTRRGRPRPLSGVAFRARSTASSISMSNSPRLNRYLVPLDRILNGANSLRLRRSAHVGSFRFRSPKHKRCQCGVPIFRQLYTTQSSTKIRIVLVKTRGHTPQTTQNIKKVIHATQTSTPPKRDPIQPPQAP